MWAGADLVPLLSLFLNALTFTLAELRRRAAGREGSDAQEEIESIRTALFQLEDLLASWIEQARETNRRAREWATDSSRGPEDPPAVHLYDSATQQAAVARDVYGYLMAGIPPQLRREGTGSLEQLLRIHAPEFFDRLVSLDERKRQIDAIADELDKNYRDGGQEALERYLAELDASLAGLEEARKQLAVFIAKEFPLSGTATHG
jgi:hypothetical protein